jgi:hypothetical protein
LLITEGKVETAVIPYFKQETKVARIFVFDNTITHTEEQLKHVPDVKEMKAAKEQGIGLYVYYPRGCLGETTWEKKSRPNYVARSHALLGRTVDEGRVWDIAATARYLADDGKGSKVRVEVVGLGQSGVLAAYAALFEPSIEEVTIIDPPTSHKDGPIFLNVLRVLDIPHALGMLAPRKLTLVGAKDKAFDKTVEIYKRAGAADKLQRK